MSLRHLRDFLLGTLRGRLILGVAAVHAVMMSIFVFDSTVRQRVVLLESKTQETLAIAESLATSSAGWISANDVAGLQELVEAERRYPELLYAMLTDERGLVLAHTDKDKVGLHVRDMPTGARETVLSHSAALVDVAVPAVLAGRHVGWARIGTSQERAGHELEDTMYRGAAYALAAILFGSLLAWRMGLRITHRLYAVQETISRVRAGERSARSGLTGPDEAASIAREFNAMLDMLDKRDHAVLLSESKYRLLLRNIHVAVIVHGPDSRILMSNPMGQSLLGLSEESLEGKSTADSTWQFVREDGSTMPVDEYPVSRVLASQQAVRDMVAGIRQGDGADVLWVLVNADPILDEQGTTCEIIVTFMDITETKRAAEALRQSEQELDAFFSQSIDACFFIVLEEPLVWNDTVDKDRALDFVFAHQRFTRVNDAMLDQCGATRESFHRLAPEKLSEHTLEHDRGLWRRFFDAGQIRLECEKRRRDGSSMCIEGEYIALYDPERRIVGCFGLQRDITERKQAESALRKRDTELSESQRLAHIGSWDWDAVNDVIWWSDEYFHIYGFDPTTQPPNYEDHLAVYTSDSARRLSEAVQRSMATGDSYQLDLELATPTPTTRWVLARGEAKRDAEGRLVGLRGTAQNITQRKQAEEEIRVLNEKLELRVAERTSDLQKKSHELQDSQMALLNIVDDLNDNAAELEAANEKLKDLDRLKSLFIASMSHELRTPLNSIIGFSSILLNEWCGPLTTEQKENLASVHRAGKHLLSLINDVIDVSKIEAGNVESLVETFDVYEVIVEATQSFTGEVKRKGLELITQASHQEIRGDRRRLLQCLLNLVSNSVKFVEKGTIAVSSAVTADGRSLQLSVEDTGIGIRQDDLEKLFLPFVRIDSHLKTAVPGTGLGLYLTRKLTTEVLKGEVAASSVYGKGSRFVLRIPLGIEGSAS